MDLSALFFGLFLGFFVTTLTKVVQQTRHIWKRGRCLSNIYLYMIWVDALANFIVAHTTFLYLQGVIQSSLGYYVGTILLWAIQTQLLAQIIANRVSLITIDRRKASLLKWTLFLAIGTVNIAVAAIWIPAHMPSATKSQTMVNIIFEYVEKSFFLVTDFGLNAYFLYLVWYQLIANGLNKYWSLFKFNAGMVFISVSMDALLLGMLTLPNPYDYVQFSPVAYIGKLYIELTMATLIGKIVRGSNAQRADDWYSSGTHTANPRSNRIQPTSHTASEDRQMPNADEAYRGSARTNANIYGGNSQSDDDLLTRYGEQDKGKGITKTVTTAIESENGENSCEEQREYTSV